MTKQLREASEAVIKVWQEAPPNVSFGSHMERALGELYSALILRDDSDADFLHGSRACRAALERIVDSRDNKNWRKPEIIQEAEQALAKVGGRF